MVWVVTGWLSVQDFAKALGSMGVMISAKVGGAPPTLTRSVTHAGNQVLTSMYHHHTHELHRTSDDQNDDES